MLYIFMGQSCTGKSTVVEKFKEMTDFEVYSGKDYLRMAKNENEAWKLFYQKLVDAACEKGSDIVYLVAETEQLYKVKDIEGSYKVKFTASLDTIKSRFAKRIHGILPQPVEKMLERKYEVWKSFDGDMVIDTTNNNDIIEICKNIIKS